VIATAVGGVPEAIENGRSGVLVAPGNDAALATAIDELASTPLGRTQLGEAARETADREFTEESYVASLAALYDELLTR